MSIASSDMKWGGITSLRNTVAKRMRSSFASADVAFDLFQMSNDLRIEREQIIGRGQQDDGNIDAFLKREQTLKYNEELDEVIKVPFFAKAVLPF